MRVPPPNPEFERALAEIGVELEAADRERLAAYLERLYEANAAMNLTRIPPEEAWIRHILDSLTLVPWLASIEPSQEPDPPVKGAPPHERAPEAPRPLRILDVGSGGGVPGLVLAIVLPSIVGDRGVRVTLLEATGKKARFLDACVRPLGLDAIVDIVNDRAETAAHDRVNLRERHDAVVSRAVGALPVLVELTLPFVRPGGFAMFIKGAKAPEEVEAARHAIGLLGGAFVASKRTPIGTLVLAGKLSRTPRIYPRPPGEPARVPLRERTAKAAKPAGAALRTPAPDRRRGRPRREGRRG